LHLQGALMKELEEEKQQEHREMGSNEQTRRRSTMQQGMTDFCANQTFLTENKV